MQRNLLGVVPATKSVCQWITSKNPPNLDGHDQPRPQGFSLKKWVGPTQFLRKNPRDEVGARHGCAILVFRLQTPARKCEIINCLPCGGDGLVDEPDVRSRDYHKFLGWSDNQLFSAITLRSRVELRYQSLTTMYYLSA